MTDTSYTPPPEVPSVPSPFGPLNSLFEFIGSANVQKALGLAQTGIAGLTSTEGKGLAMHISGMTVGSVFTLAVHYFDALRAKIGR